MITGDLEHPRHVGYPDDAGFISVRMALEPGAFDTVVGGMIVADSAALREEQPAPLPTTRGELEALINTRFNALNMPQVPLG